LGQQVREQRNGVPEWGAWREKTGRCSLVNSKTSKSLEPVQGLMSKQRSFRQTRTTETAGRPVKRKRPGAKGEAEGWNRFRFPEPSGEPEHLNVSSSRNRQTRLEERAAAHVKGICEWGKGVEKRWASTEDQGRAPSSERRNTVECVTTTSAKRGDWERDMGGGKIIL